MLKLVAKETELHIVDQSGQPYGSTRRCCSYCGRMCWSGMAGSAQRWTDDWAAYNAAADRCSVANGDGPLEI